MVTSRSSKLPARSFLRWGEEVDFDQGEEGLAGFAEAVVVLLPETGSPVRVMGTSRHALSAVQLAIRETISSPPRAVSIVGTCRSIHAESPGITRQD